MLRSLTQGSYPNTRDCALEGLELFGSTKHKLDLPPGADCDTHRPDKVNYSIPRPNTQIKRSMHSGVFDFVEHDVAHTTSVLENDCPTS